MGIELGEAIKMCSVYPARVMHKVGMNAKIDINENADLLCLNADRQFIKIVVS